VVVFLSIILALCWEECVVTSYADGSSVKKCAERMMARFRVIMEMSLNVNTAVLHHHSDENCTGGKFQL